MNRSRPEPETGAAKDRGIQFIAGFLLMAGIAVAVFGLVVIPLFAITENDEGTVRVASVLSRSPGIETLVPSDVPTKWVYLSSTTDEFDLTAQKLPTHLRLLSVADVSWLSLGTLVAAWMVFGLLRSIGEGRPFDRGNAGRLCWLTGLAVAGPIIFSAVQSLAASRVLDYLHMDGGNLEPPAVWAFWPFVVATLILAVANAFRYGRTLQDDVTGMV
ncbi:MAG: DUF2975 domain-containing protein [Actinomycetia bacterium]|nr:DUF2975 domain-containing protein [Actinomycetes bacterium]